MVLAVAALIYANRKQNRKELQIIENEMNTAVTQGKLTIGEKVVFRNRIVALDAVKKMLLYIKLEKGEAKFDLIDLEQVHSCEVVKTGNKWIATGKKAARPVEEHINAINLQLHASNNISFSINFYNEMEDDASEMKALSHKAIQWRDTIKELQGAA